MVYDERIALVDDEDRVVGSKLRKQLTDDDCWREVCVWIENNNSQVLLQQRAPNLKINPSLWTNAVIGTVTDNDSYDATAVRETEEEIGLSGVYDVSAQRFGQTIIELLHDDTLRP